LRYRLAAITAKEYADNGFTVITQDNYYGESLPLMLRMLEPADARAFVLCPGLETIKQRASERGKGGYEHFDIDALYDDFMKTTPRIGTWIDNSDETPEQTVSRIITAL
jgi:hypothetical protein